jgi:hypothetical protein
MTIVIQENEWTDGIAVGRRQAAVEHHVTIVDDLFGRKDGRDRAAHENALSVAVVCSGPTRILSKLPPARESRH